MNMNLLAKIAIIPLVVFGCMMESETPQNQDPQLTLTSGCRIPTSLTKLTVLQGESVWISQVSPQCRPEGWQLISIPSESQTKVKSDGSYIYFIPDQVGEYVLKNIESNSLINYRVVSNKGFINYNYYPLGSVGVSEGSIWVANVFQPNVSRLNSKTLKKEAVIPVGSWPVSLQVLPGISRVLVAQKASDSIGVIDSSQNRLIDNIWVGDEPSFILKNSDETEAYISLQGENTIAVLDTAEMKVLKKIPTVKAPSGMALTPDGKRLYVAAMRSGHPSRFPYTDDDEANERDIDIIDLTSGSVIKSFYNVGTTIRSMIISPNGKELYIANLTNDTTKPLGSPTSESFNYEVRVLSSETGETLRAVNLSPKNGVHQPYPSLHQMAMVGDRLFIVSEATDSLIELNASTLEIVSVREAIGRPRSLAISESGLYVHGHQDRKIIYYDIEQESPPKQVTVVDENRPLELANGQKFFTGAGRGFAKSWACNSCHLDGLTDTLIWNAGPVKDTHVTRPLFWLEGTDWLGWQGYLSSVKNYAYVVTSNVGVRPSTEEALNLGTYLSSLTPPPAANHLTDRDGSLSPEALEGKEIFEGKAACASCHYGPLFTNRRVIGQSINPDKADTPSLVGVYRHQVWMKHGEALTLKQATEQMTSFFNVDLSEQEVNQITRYLKELTAREFFLLRSYPRPQPGMPADDTVQSKFLEDLPWPIWKAPRLVFSHPILNEVENLKLITLLKSSTGEKVAFEPNVENQELFLNISQPLDFSETYSITIAKGLKSQLNTETNTESQITFRTPDRPKMRLGSKYTILVDMPDLRAVNSGRNPLDPAIISKVPFTFKVEEKPSGGILTFDYGSDLEFVTQGTLDGDRLFIPPTPIPASPFSFADGFSGFQARLIDSDSDGVGDSAQGLYTLSGPGFRIDGLSWSLKLDN